MSNEERKEEIEEEIERGGARAELVRGNILRIRWVTGKTSAARFFGRYGREGRPDFFRLLFGAIAGSLREHFPEDKANELFNNIKNSNGFKDSLNDVFESMKRWFFDEIIPKYKLERGDVFAIITNLELDINTGELKWDKNTAQVIYWIRSDRVQEKCREMSAGAGTADVEGLKRENEELKKKIKELESRINGLVNENEELKKKLESIKELLGSGSI